MKNKLLSEDAEAFAPYKLLFPLGLVAAVISVLFWVLFNYQVINFYPRAAHSNLMFFGFFWSFISGFLMTAIPKMTRTDPATTGDIIAAVLLIAMQIIFNFLNLQNFSLIIFTVQISVLLLFGLTRVFRYGRLPFSGFVFIPVAFTQAIVAIILFTFFDLNSSQNLKILWSEALVLNLIIGLGSRLIPVITRVKNAVSPDQGSAAVNWSLSLSVLFLLNAGYYLEVFLHKESGMALRLLAIATASIYNFKIFADLSTTGNLGKMIRLSIILVFVGQSMALFLPGQNLSGSHIMYISGLALLTILISFRVILAHGQTDINYELTGKLIPAVAYSLIGAALFRFFINGNFGGVQIWLAVTLFVAGAIAWLVKFLHISFSSPKA